MSEKKDTLIIVLGSLFFIALIAFALSLTIVLFQKIWTPENQLANPSPIVKKKTQATKKNPVEPKIDKKSQEIARNTVKYIVEQIFQATTVDQVDKVVEKAELLLSREEMREIQEFANTRKQSLKRNKSE